jgi:hypothetical protein
VAFFERLVHTSQLRPRSLHFGEETHVLGNLRPEDRDVGGVRLLLAAQGLGGGGLLVAKRSMRGGELVAQRLGSRHELFNTAVLRLETSADDVRVEGSEGARISQERPTPLEHGVLDVPPPQAFFR